MICRPASTSSSNIWMRYTSFVVLGSISFLWISWIIILSLQGHDNDHHLSSYDNNKNNGFIQQHFIKIETIYRHFAYNYLPKARKHHTNNELFNEDVGNSINKHGRHDDDEIIHMKQSVSLYDSKRLLALEGLEINKLVEILHEDMMIIEENNSSTTMKMKSISHG